jgi:hypothetical protein
MVLVPTRWSEAMLRIGISLFTAFAVVLVFDVIDIDTQTNSAQAQQKKRRKPPVPNRKKPASKGKKKPTKPKSKLPSQEGVRVRVRIAQVSADRGPIVARTAAKIDALIESNLSKHGLKPNPMSADSQFLRRVYLDISGTIPTAKQAESFLKSRSPTKRARLIDQLLNSTGYASHFFNFWADVMRIVDRPANNNYIRPYGDWVKQALRDNMPYDEMVHEMLTAEGKVWDSPAAGYTLRDPSMPLDNMNNTVRIFLGTRIGCAQCHDHPFDRWTQHDFYQLAAFTGGVDTVDRRRGRMMGMKAGALTKALREKGGKSAGLARRIVRLNRNFVWENSRKRLRFPSDYGYEDAKPGQVVQPAVIFGRMPTMDGKSSRRQAFADWITSESNPRFTLTVANRLWKRAFGVGLIEPVDNLTDDSVASNPALMKLLENEMKFLKHDLKEFQRVVYNTKAYQRAVTYEDLNPEKEYHFPGPVLRRMTAEQVWDSLLTLTLANPDAFLRAPDEEYQKAVDIDTTTITVDKLLQKANRMTQLRKQDGALKRKRTYKGTELARASELPQPLPAGHFLRQFGQSDRSIISGNSTEGTVPQLLVMFNGPVTHMMLEAGSVIYNEVISQKQQKDQIDLVFLSLLSRKPTTRERDIAKREIKKNKAAGFGNVIWALLNTREFLLVQ